MTVEVPEPREEPLAPLAPNRLQQTINLHRRYLSKDDLVSYADLATVPGSKLKGFVAWTDGNQVWLEGDSLVRRIASIQQLDKVGIIRVWIDYADKSTLDLRVAHREQTISYEADNPNSLAEDRFHAIMNADKASNAPSDTEYKKAAKTRSRINIALIFINLGIAAAASLALLFSTSNLPLALWVVVGVVEWTIVVLLLIIAIINRRASRDVVTQPLVLAYPDKPGVIERDRRWNYIFGGFGIVASIAAVVAVVLMVIIK